MDRVTLFHILPDFLFNIYIEQAKQVFFPPNLQMRKQIQNVHMTFSNAKKLVHNILWKSSSIKPDVNQYFNNSFMICVGVIKKSEFF